MHTDTIFYQIFLTFHTLLFELLGQPTENAEGYQFTSVEVKEKAFRFDGIFMPDSEEKPIYFVEVQFQNKPEFYWELITEINIYLNQYKPEQDWQAVALFAKRSLDVEKLTNYQQELVNSGRIKRIYLDEIASGSIGMGLIELIVSKENQSQELVKTLMARTKTEVSNDSERQGIIELLESVLMSKFSQLSRQEIEAMFLVSDIKQTRVYQEAKQEGEQEGRQEGERSLLLRILSKRVGKLITRHIESINSLTIAQLEDLGEALLDFGDINDLEEWLKSHTES
ncbi:MULTISPECIES: Rpn family recombination-promoting nuclease/putative transposase [Nostocales]|jgi:predicted transposase/invertase (TIGR01784 family)|uniref:Rpn family recombination-promoting nuclease/putative transposase n=1 Tax=Dolichospermum flos-aquae UHCC 0037 TaxID=2590026 RepID=A0ACC7SBE0_DOLFA|nr:MULTISPECIES: Rpn family recombination-promoting nuclease/putative transposase [Nostocales]MBO1067418.1 Rpn family recombination-promoting nuclease/putative transposase [Anabaena sp. 54]MTJ45848.1 Rpn family recombination-promoting nuclease/putative transposase [Dolichospermum flos-aquae UHCC 0037]